MSKYYSTNMLRTRRRDNNVKPNRRLDRKSSRGMLYENEELRLRTININAEIERGQYDIKKLKRENEMLKKEIWCLRDEYEKLDKLLKDKEIDFSSSSTTCSTSDSESCSSCTEESEEVETSQNLENVQKTNMKNLHTEFDHLSVVPEETSPENSENRSSLPPQPPTPPPLPVNNYFQTSDVIQPDQSYPVPKNFFSPINKNYVVPSPPPPPLPVAATIVQNHENDENILGPNEIYNGTFYQNMILVPPDLSHIEKTDTDLIVKTDNQNFTPISSFSNGGNLEELLNDIETISKDILEITSEQKNHEDNSKYKSELNVVLMPNPMPLLGFEKYKDIQKSIEDLKQNSKSLEKLHEYEEKNPFYFPGTPTPVPPDFFTNHEVPVPQTPTIEISNAIPDSSSKSILRDQTSSEQLSSENEDNLKVPKSPMSIRRKVSIHFKGKKDKVEKEASTTPKVKRNSIFDLKFGFHNNNNNTTTNSNNNNNNSATTEIKHQKTPSIESRKSITDNEKTNTSSSSDRKKIDDKKQRKSASISPERKHGGGPSKEEKKHKKHTKKHHADNTSRRSGRRNTMLHSSSIDRLNRERSYSICTERSHFNNMFYDDYERERTNSMSSCDTAIQRRKLSNLSNIPLSGKVPWCACWGNGCI